MEIPEILTGQKALVTGATRGIGRACAQSLAAAGAAVAINYRSDSSPADELAEEIRASGGEALPVQGDVAREEDAEHMVAETIREFGTIDILVNNAGLQADASLDDMTLEQWERVLRVNLTGQFLTTRAAVREFKRRGVVPDVSRSAGKIINMSSVHDATAG